ncbi:hypothetical protein LOZ55_006807, partial [Ophidiomyces ophidiicola]
MSDIAVLQQDDFEALSRRLCKMSKTIIYISEMSMEATLTLEIPSKTLIRTLLMSVSENAMSASCQKIWTSTPTASMSITSMSITSMPITEIMVPVHDDDGQHNEKLPAFETEITDKAWTAE